MRCIGSREMKIFMIHFNSFFAFNMRNVTSCWLWLERGRKNLSRVHTMSDFFLLLGWVFFCREMSISKNQSKCEWESTVRIRKENGITFNLDFNTHFYVSRLTFSKWRQSHIVCVCMCVFAFSPRALMRGCRTEMLEPTYRIGLHSPWPKINIQQRDYFLSISLLQIHMFMLHNPCACDRFGIFNIPSSEKMKKRNKKILRSISRELCICTGKRNFTLKFYIIL